MGFARSKGWTRVIAGAGLLLTLLSASTAGARGSQTWPLPAPGTYRMIRIGPEALVMEDDRGRVTMVDEATPPARTPGKALNGFFTILGAGFLLLLENQNGIFERRAGPDVGVQ